MGEAAAIKILQFGIGAGKSKIDVIEDIGVARSRATVISPAGATVHAKDVVELTKWVPAEKSL